MIQGDRLFGRGAMDFKGGLAAFTVAAMRLAREGAPRTRDLILLAEADEEGGAYGTTWLAENHWAKIDASESINEGGWIFAGGSGGARLMGITTIDKNSLSVTFRTRGTSTHSSRPLPDSALRRLVRALDRVERYDTAPRITPTARTYLRAWARASSAQTARRLRAITTTRTSGGPPPAGGPAARRPLGRAVRRAGAQHLRADDRRRRLPRQRAARHRRGDGEHAHAARPEAAAADPRAAPRGRRPAGGDHADRHRRRDGRGDARRVRQARRAGADADRHRPLPHARARGPAPVAAASR